MSQSLADPVFRGKFPNVGSGQEQRKQSFSFLFKECKFCFMLSEVGPEHLVNIYVKRSEAKPV